VKGGVRDSFSTVSSETKISISPVAILGFLEVLSITEPFT
jgi:hypothetical protein